MTLRLKNISRSVNGQAYIKHVDLTLESGSFNVLLGRTLSGKTSLMRLMAGLDRPDEGSVAINGADVTGVPVQKRNVSMVYQQFINFPHLTVRENIASPLRCKKYSEKEINRRVKQVSGMLHIDHLLDRLPLEISGGQQQRTAMARALVKDASLILFDEPLVNLDYKLREELRYELRDLFARRNSIAVYATTEPAEAFALGGSVSLLHEGEIIQSGVPPEVYHYPNSVSSAELMNEPAINLFRGSINDTELILEGEVSYPRGEKLRTLSSGQYVFGIRPAHISLVPESNDDLEMSALVKLTEISGSESFIHASMRGVDLVLQLSGVHEYTAETSIRLYLPTHKLFVFEINGTTIHSPNH